MSDILALVVDIVFGVVHCMHDKTHYIVCVTEGTRRCGGFQN